MKYVKQLDSLRAIAVLLVIVSHWAPVNYFLSEARLGTLGLFGVDMFFVLSGFLITNILLEGKSAIGNGVSIGNVVKNFYARRALRIFPIFYLTIFVLAISKLFIHEINLTQLLYGATYTINFYFHKMQVWGEYTGHFWSLAVEEQFYLLWPLLILLINRKYLPHTICAFILMGFTSRIFENGEFGFLVTYTCFDAFGLGALLAWILMYRTSLITVFYRYVTIAAIISALVLVYELYLDTSFLLLQRSLHAVIALWIITHIMLKRLKKPNTGFWLFDYKYLISIGRISYGIYVYHLYIPHIRKYLFSHFFHIQSVSANSTANDFILFLLDLIIVLAVARLSWSLIEQPILKHKKHFQNNNQTVRSSRNAVSIDLF